MVAPMKWVDEAAERMIQHLGADKAEEIAVILKAIPVKNQSLAITLDRLVTEIRRRRVDIQRMRRI